MKYLNLKMYANSKTSMNCAHRNGFRGGKIELAQIEIKASNMTSDV